MDPEGGHVALRTSSCRFELEAEAIDMAVELDNYREVLAILSSEPAGGASGGQRTANVLWTPRAGNQFPDPTSGWAAPRRPRSSPRKRSGALARRAS